MADVTIGPIHHDARLCKCWCARCDGPLDSLLEAVILYLERFVSVDAALVDGFDLEKWCDVARGFIATGREQ